jgi:hypothetical protein
MTDTAQVLAKATAETFWTFNFEDIALLIISTSSVFVAILSWITNRKKYVDRKLTLWLKLETLRDDTKIMLAELRAEIEAVKSANPSGLFQTVSLNVRPNVWKYNSIGEDDEAELAMLQLKNYKKSSWKLSTIKIQAETFYTSNSIQKSVGGVRVRHQEVYRTFDEAELAFGHIERLHGNVAQARKLLKGELPIRIRRKIHD